MFTILKVYILNMYIYVWHALEMLQSLSILVLICVCVCPKGLRRSNQPESFAAELGVMKSKLPLVVETGHVVLSPLPAVPRRSFKKQVGVYLAAYISRCRHSQKVLPVKPTAV